MTAVDWLVLSLALALTIEWTLEEVFCPQPPWQLRTWWLVRRLIRRRQQRRH